MTEPVHELPTLIMMVEAIIVLAVMVRIGLGRIGVSALIGYLGLGFILRLGPSLPRCSQEWSLYPH